MQIPPFSEDKFHLLHRLVELEWCAKRIRTFLADRAGGELPSRPNAENLKLATKKDLADRMGLHPSVVDRAIERGWIPGPTVPLPPPPNRYYPEELLDEMAAEIERKRGEAE